MTLLVCDPPNIIIGSRAGLSFDDFLPNLTPIVAIEVAAFALGVPRLVRRRPGPGGRRHAAHRAGGDPRPRAAGQVRHCADLAGRAEDVLAGVERETLLFFAGLFVMIGALVKTGVIGGPG